MAALRRLRPFQTVLNWTGLSVLAPLGMLIVSGLMLLEMRRDAWDRAEQTSKNLLQVIERDIARNIEILDLSLQAVVDNLHAPGVDKISPELRQLVLFDRATTAKDLGVVLVLDENADIVADAGALPPRRANYADREYFQAHKAQAGLGLYIGRPLVSRLTGDRMVPFSRRVNKPDGSFGGVVLGTLKLTYFSHLFDQIGLGQSGAINLYLRDGTRLMRHPYVESDIGATMGSTANFSHFLQEGQGTLVATSVRDGIERHYSFTQVGDLPLVLNVSLSTQEIEVEWREKALAISAIVLILCGTTIALSLLFGRELRQRAEMQQELARLSRTDGLTGLANRRRFEHAFVQACEQASRNRRPLALLIVDADHFKRFNDLFGHAVGDEVLKGVARSLAASIHRPEHLVCRVGGEEFALLLPDTDQTEALRVAEAVHAEMSTLAVASAGIPPGTVTVSVGVAVGQVDGTSTAAAERLYRLADSALYEAKAAGRNQTRCVVPRPDETRALIRSAA